MMKKLTIALASALCIGALLSPALAETDAKALKAIDDIRKGNRGPHEILTLRVIDDAILPTGSIGAGEIADDSVAAADIGVIAQTDTNVVADSTSWTPAFVGQILVGTVSNKAWVAHGLTTDDWIEISN